MDTQKDTQHDENKKNKVTSNKPEELKKNSDYKNSKPEVEDPEHEYIAGEKEGDFPPDVKMNNTTTGKQQKPAPNQPNQKGLL